VSHPLRYPLGQEQEGGVTRSCTKFATFWRAQPGRVIPPGGRGEPDGVPVSWLLRTVTSWKSEPYRAEQPIWLERRVDEPDGSALQLIGERHDRGPLRRPSAGAANNVNAGLSRKWRSTPPGRRRVDGRVVRDIRNSSRGQPQPALIGRHPKQFAGRASVATPKTDSFQTCSPP